MTKMQEIRVRQVDGELNRRTVVVPYQITGLINLHFTGRKLTPERRGDSEDVEEVILRNRSLSRPFDSLGRLVDFVQEWGIIRWLFGW